MVSISNQITNLRKHHGLSQQDLADKLNVTRQAVSNWERGKSEPDIEMMNRMVSYFDIDMNAFIRGSEQKHSTDRKMTTLLFLCTLALFIVHMVFAIMGHIKLIGVMIMPGMVFFIALIMFFMFGNSIKTGDYSIIAGYNKKKDDDLKVKKQLLLTELFTMIFALLFSILYFLVYWIEQSRMMPISLIMMAAFLISFALIIVLVNKKIKSR